MKKMLLVVLFLSWASLHSMHQSRPLKAVNITFLKGTHDILPDDSYAPFWGLTFIEQEIAKQWYMLSDKCIEVGISDALSTVSGREKDSVLSFVSEQKNNATEALIAHMFHMVGGTFTLTNAPNNPVRQLTPEHIGKILKVVHDAQAIATGSLAIAAKTSKTLSSEAELQEKLEKVLVSFELKKPSGASYVAKDFRSFCKALVGSLQECSGNEPMYAKNTTQGILLGYMLAKSNDRADLQSYFRGFLEDDAFILPAAKYSNQELNALLSQKPNLADISSFANFLCAKTYQEKYMAPLPKITGNQSVTYQGFNFADCVESTMLNLTNIATYHQAGMTLGKAPEGVTMSKNLETFYNNSLHANPAEVGNTAVHKAWAAIVENMPGVTYGRVGIPQTEQFILAPSNCDGIIPTTQVDAHLPSKTINIAGSTYEVKEKKVGNKTYWLVPTSSGLHCFELMPTASNITAIINNLFNLRLFTSEDEVLKPELAEQNFEAMCTKLGWSTSNEALKQIKALESGHTGSIAISIKTSGNTQFKIHLTTKAHGYVSVDNISKQKRLNSNDELLNASPAVQAACIASSMIDIDLFGNEKFSSLAPFNPVINLDKRLTFIKYLLEKRPQSAGKYSAQLIKSMTLAQDVHFQNAVTDLFIKTDFKSIPSEAVSAFGIMASVSYLKSQTISPIIVYSKIALDSDHLTPTSKLNILNLQDFYSMMHIARLQGAAMLTLKQMVEKGLISQNEAPQLLQWAEKAMLGNERSQNHCFLLLYTMVEKELISQNEVPQLLQWIEKIMLGGEWSQKSSISLLGAMVTKGLISENEVPQLLQWIEKTMLGDNDSQYFSILLLKKMVNKGLISQNEVPQLLQWAEKAMLGNEWGQKPSISLLETMVDKKLIDSAHVAAVEALLGKINDPDLAQDTINIKSRLPKRPSITEKPLQKTSSMLRFLNPKTDVQAEALTEARRQHFEQQAQFLQRSEQQPTAVEQLANERQRLTTQGQNNNPPLHSNIAHRQTIEPAALRNEAINQKPRGGQLTAIRISAAARALKQSAVRAMKAAISR